MRDQISILIYQVGVAGSAEMHFPDLVPQKGQIGFGQYHADDTLSGTPKRNGDRHVWLSPVRSVDGAYIVLALERFIEFRRFTLVGKVRRKVNSSVGHLHHFHTARVDNRGVGEAVIVFDQETQEQLLFFAAQRIETYGAGGIGEALDLASNKVMNAVGRHRRKLRLQLGGVSLDLPYGIRIGGEDDNRQRNAEKAKAPHQETTTDTAATKRNSGYFFPIPHL